MITRRTFVKSAAALAAATPASAEILIQRTLRPVVIADYSGFEFKNGGTENAVAHAFRLITEGRDVLDAPIAGVNIPELDPLETGIGYGALPNANGVVQLDASCMHGPRKQAGAVACIEGVRTPSRVAKAVMENTDHHLLVGDGATGFARAMGFTVEEDLNTETSRRLWLEWKRRIDPEHYLDPAGDSRKPAPRHEKDPGYAAARSMVRDGLIREGSFWGTINCDAIGPSGDLCGVTSTSETVVSMRSADVSARVKLRECCRWPPGILASSTCRDARARSRAVAWPRDDSAPAATSTSART
jgi:N4-(beta-N-acetylglucosaminyl)-L-asparaginase